MARRGKSQTLSTDVRDKLRQDILDGCWSPGEKLQLVGLSDRYGTSSTVIREALTRLSGERLVELKPNRGFFVPGLSLEQLKDFNELRCLSEEFGIRLAIERGDLQWESEVIAAHHTLERTPQYAEEGSHNLNAAWRTAHKNFHEKLLSACQLPVLMGLTSNLADETSLYRRWAAPGVKTRERDIAAEHREILEAVLNRDAEAAGPLLRKHYTTSMEMILTVGLIAPDE
ncbi:GntR family transcriptional regulator [Nesterenkonia muleiensis]|uniref:GntR family transcriptional regulator n=1 Tax=Nesterenkonia muleiensis TaxID=2282648 RepID=UPI000E74DE06|nr:GntR family transcriptional regulator [Nesterenkonia muleiensis]